MNKMLLLMTLLFIMNACCSEEPAILQKETDVSVVSCAESISGALESAERMYADLFGKTDSDLRIENVEKISSNTRSASQDADQNLYVVNYSQGKGFAILCDNPRSVSVIAISNEGSLNSEDLKDNEVISWYLDNVGEPIALSRIWEPIVPIDTNVQTIVKPVLDRTEYSKPLLKGLLANLHQFNPLNRLCQGAVGCAPLACGTVMAYHKWPKSYSGHVWDWDAMHADESSSDWCWLFKYLGDKDNCGSYYFFDEINNNYFTVSFFDNIVRTFSNFGYGKVLIEDFSVSSISSELRNGYPVLCDGRHVNAPDEGHTWVIDGGYCDSVKYPGMQNEDGSQDSTTIYSYYFHCVWGEAGKANGYFLFDVTTGKMGGYPDKGDYEYNESHGFIYKNMKIGHNIRPLR